MAKKHDKEREVKNRLADPHGKFRDGFFECHFFPENLGRGCGDRECLAVRVNRHYVSIVTTYQLSPVSIITRINYHPYQFIIRINYHPYRLSTLGTTAWARFTVRDDVQEQLFQCGGRILHRQQLSTVFCYHSTNFFFRFLAQTLSLNLGHIPNL